MLSGREIFLTTQSTHWFPGTRLIYVPYSILAAFCSVLTYVGVTFASHEIVGVVREVGSTVQRFKVGDCVGVGTYVNSCRDCEYCNDGLEVHCSKGTVHTFDGIDDDGTITKGGYSTHIVVHER